MEAFARLLYDLIGLDPESIGISSIARAVQQRIVASKSPGPQAYLEHLRGSPAEVQALVEAIVVPETWFFRDPKAFQVVADHARQMPAPRRLRFLCLPCSTGEEPYSLAMALLDTGFPTERFQIDAVDISERVLAHARQGIYGRNSFRGRDLEFRDRYFASTPEGWVLDPAIRKLVRFQRGNLLDDAAMSDSYDAVFCRNLLIYFDVATQRRAILALERRLAPDGIFCVGPAETGLLAPFEFTHTRIPLAFAFRKGKPVTPPAPEPVRQNRTVPFLLPRRLPAAKPAVTVPASHPVSAEPDLAEALRLADEGRLTEVAGICHAFLKQGNVSAQAYYLLGLVSDASHRMEEAAACYRKALYIDPQHHDALLHASLLAEKLGDAATARSLRERARRTAGRAA